MGFVLASASPRRRDLVLAAGFICEVDPVDVDERLHAGESAERYVARVARLKADAGAARHPGRLVLAADTVVVVDGQVLGKPADAGDAARMLGLLSGRAHEVLTAVAVAGHGTTSVETDRTTVWMTPLSAEDVRWYVATGEPRDKAGGYAVQGLASRFVTRIEGSYSNVVGLPMALVARLLAERGETGRAG